MKPDLNQIVRVPLSDLMFDVKNPRFARRTGSNSQEAIAKTLWDEMFLEELIISISVNGFYVQEPLLVTPDEKDPSKYVVIEGNRRLASVKILTDSELAKAVKATNLPPVDEAIKSSLEELPVIIYPSRDDLWTYLSFRHVNGPRGWSSISKAEFVADLHLVKDIPFDQILSSTGDKNKTSLKLYNGLMILRQGEEQTRFKREDFNAAKFNFSHLYTMIQFPNTRKYLGIENIDLSKPIKENPVPAENIDKLEELLGWIFGNRALKQEPVVKSQNPDLRHLDDVLKSAPALVSLRDGDGLIIAHEYTGEEDRRLQDLVIKSYNSLSKAVGLMESYKGDEDVVMRLKKIKSLAETMIDQANKPKE